MERLSDLLISGMGKANGGKFMNVDISGLGTIMGDVEAERIDFSGKGTIQGDAIFSRKLEISGMGTVTGTCKGGQIISSGSGLLQGQVEVELVEAAGNLKVHGEARIQELLNDGRCRFEQSLKAEKISSRGLLSVGADVETEEFYSQGSFSIGGLLNANKMDIEIHGYCQAREIGGEEVRVTSGRYISRAIIGKLLSPFLGSGRELDKLTAEVIEGTVVSVEYTVAKVVRGQAVKIGPECKIDLVEYSESIEIDPRAAVNKQCKI